MALKGRKLKRVQGPDERIGEIEPYGLKPERTESGARIGRRGFLAASAAFVGMAMIGPATKTVTADTVLVTDPADSKVRVYEGMKLESVSEGGKKAERWRKAVFSDSHGGKHEFDTGWIRHMPGNEESGSWPKFEPLGSYGLFSTPREGMLLGAPYEWNAPLPDGTLLIPRGDKADAPVTLPKNTIISSSEPVPMTLPAGTKIQKVDGTAIELAGDGDVTLGIGDHAVLGSRADLVLGKDMRARIFPRFREDGDPLAQITKIGWGENEPPRFRGDTPEQKVPKGWIVEVPGNSRVDLPTGIWSAKKPEKEIAEPVPVAFQGKYRTPDGFLMTIFQDDDGIVEGKMDRGAGSMRGSVKNGVLEYEWRDNEGGAHGVGQMMKTGKQTIRGRWRYHDTPAEKWDGAFEAKK